MGATNLARDMSILNRKNFPQTSAKGVPLVYHTRCTLHGPINTDADGSTRFIIQTVPQNWVYRNGAVKLHAAREAMYRKNGVKKSERGPYDHTVRYGWDTSDTSDGGTGVWAAPIYFRASTEYSLVEGTWDTTEVVDNSGNVHNVYLYNDDPSADNMDEESGGSGNVSLPQLYLNSRSLVLEDQSDQDDTFPAKFSLLKELFTPTNDGSDELRDVVDDQQDNPPYDRDSLTASCTKLVTASTGHLGLQYGNSSYSFSMDVPFGIFAGISKILDASVGSSSIYLEVEVLGTSEMQG